MAVRKSAAKKTAKTAARRARPVGQRTRAAKSTRRRPTSAPKRVVTSIAEPAVGKAEPNRPAAVLPVPMATFVF